MHRSRRKKKDDEAMKVKVPDDTALRQQRLPAWQPILSAPWVVCCYLLIGVVFIPMGAMVLVAGGKVESIQQRYDDLPPGPYKDPNGITYVSDNNIRGRTQVKWLQLNITKELRPPIYMYYRISNFFQNHRRFTRSAAYSQLNGKKTSLGGLGECSPVSYAGELHDEKGRKPPSGNLTNVYAPCGLIAWSMFNDTFTVYKANPKAGGGLENCEASPNKCEILCSGNFFGTNSTGGGTSCKKKGIAWDSDVEKFFKTPDPEYGLQSKYGDIKYYYKEGPRTTPEGNIEGHVIPLQTDEDFIVWMRTASQAQFNKLYRIFDATTFPEGTVLYIRIVDRYRADLFDGKKYIILSEADWMGRENAFMGWIYLVVGIICLILACVFAAKAASARKGRMDPHALPPIPNHS